MAKCSSDPRVAYPEVKVQVRYLVRVVGIVAPFAPRGSVFRKNSSYRAPGGISTGDPCRVPQQRYATGEPGKVQGRDRVGIVERSRVKGPLGSVFGENLFYRETQGTRLGGRHMAKRSSDPRVAYPEVKVHVRDLVRVLGVVAPFAPRVSIRENLFYRAPRAKWAQKTCAGCPQQRYATGEPGKVQGWDRVGIVEWSYGNRARRVSIRENSFYSQSLGTRLGSATMWPNVVLTPG